MKPVAVRAPAKVNARLEVLGGRPDGYHEVRTWMLALELADGLRGTVDPVGSPGSVHVEIRGPQATPDVPPDATNLAVRAARAALARVGELTGTPPPALRLELTKDVPSQAGLGGGSSDAAAALRLVEALSEVDLGAEWRAELLAGLGSDCPFFDRARRSGAALCTGRGERVEVLDGPEPAWWIALLTPVVECSTPRVYRALERARSEKKATGAAPTDAPPRRWLTGAAHRARAWVHNELEAAALAAVPGLRPWRDLLDAGGAPSTSGCRAAARASSGSSTPPPRRRKRSRRPPPKRAGGPSRCAVAGSPAPARGDPPTLGTSDARGGWCPRGTPRRRGLGVPTDEHLRDPRQAPPATA